MLPSRRRGSLQSSCHYDMVKKARLHVAAGNQRPLPGGSGGYAMPGFLKSAACAAAALAFVSIPSVAHATGTIEIHHKSGTVSRYSDVEIKVFSGSLFLTSDDGDGTIVITRAACSYQGKVIVCLPITAALVQEGESQALSVKTG